MIPFPDPKKLVGLKVSWNTEVYLHHSKHQNLNIGEVDMGADNSVFNIFLGHDDDSGNADVLDRFSKPDAKKSVDLKYL